MKPRAIRYEEGDDDDCNDIPSVSRGLAPVNKIDVFDDDDSNLVRIDVNGNLLDYYCSLTSSNALNCCSAYIGHSAAGTPNRRLSSDEFHPQCDTNPPTARWDKTATCGAQPMTFLLERL
ncbi:hypothetical protein L484_014257 [Morus notabilis]|uniref:Uncharacterized protein n=1 Tax=Morus notabilis TaxID=981085 RepID=W9RMG7_9ROSA|nr:hypothetical protein L484_014257 [Morus notabilis]